MKLTPLHFKSFLLFAIGALLLSDCLYLVTVKVTHLGVIVPAVIGLTLVMLSLGGRRWQLWLAERRWRQTAWRIVLVGFFAWVGSLLVFFVTLQKPASSEGSEFNPSAIIVLGSSTPNGQASPTLAERLKLAAGLARQHLISQRPTPDDIECRHVHHS